MMTVCQNCGDRGFLNALIYCNECKVYAVHCYCLERLPVPFGKHVVWFCVDCESKVVNPNDFDKLPILAEQSGSLESDQVRKRNPFKRLKKKLKRKVNTCSLTISEFLTRKMNSSLQPFELHCSENAEKDQQLGKQDEFDRDSFNEVVESLESENSQPALKLHEIANQKRGAGDGTCTDLQLVRMDCCDNDVKDQKLGRQNRLDEDSFQEEAESINAKSSQAASCNHQLQLLDMNCCVDGDKDQKLGRKDGYGEYILHDEAEYFKSKISQLAIWNPQPLQMYRCKDRERDQRLGRGNGLDDGSFDEECESHNTKNCQPTISKVSDSEGQRCYIRAQPIKNPIWRGKIDIFSKNFGSAGGFIAHLSSLACSRVREEAKLLPKLLSPELHPRSLVWPKAFQKWGPSDDSIALYIFPDSERNEKAFDRLVQDMICQDLAMRTVVGNAELLIYSSKVLPMTYWRFQMKFYLWGVFRGKQRLDEAIVPQVEKGLTEDITWNVQSPVSPLSNCIYAYRSGYQSESVINLDIPRHEY